LDAESAFKKLNKALGPGKVRTGEPMSLHTTMRVGGPTDIFIEPESAEDIAVAVRACREAGAPLMVIGNGSNLVVRDGGIRGAVLHLGEGFSKLESEGEAIRAQGGALLSRVAAEAMRLGLCGMEFAAGIPGSVGGAAAMNAGAYGGEMKDVVREVRAVTPEGGIVRLANGEMRYGYRRSRALEEGLIVAAVELALKRGDAGESRRLAEEYAAQRRQKQPLELPSAGSFFKRPPGNYAGTLIEKAGLKGVSVGGAKVSEKHAGFIVNAGNATAADILALMALVRRKVWEDSGVALEPEVRIVGEDLPWGTTGG
jgi:UDP-N-acetylmuramate dehydrogenase